MKVLTISKEVETIPTSEALFHLPLFVVNTATKKAIGMVIKDRDQWQVSTTVGKILGTHDSLEDLVKFVESRTTENGKCLKVITNMKFK